MQLPKPDPEVMTCLNRLYQLELAGVSRYLHYSFMILGHNRIPIQKWFRDQANESAAHAITLGEKITSYGGHPTMSQDPIEESNVHTVDQILGESLTFETQALELYRKLVGLAKDDLALEEMARAFVRAETDHIDEVRKMLRTT